MTRLETTGVSTEESDLSIDIAVEGPEDEANRAYTEIVDRAAKTMNALESGKHPDECEGGFMAVNWEQVLEEINAE